MEQGVTVEFFAWVTGVLSVLGGVIIQLLLHIYKKDKQGQDKKNDKFEHISGLMETHIAQQEVTNKRLEQLMVENKKQTLAMIGVNTSAISKLDDEVMSLYIHRDQIEGRIDVMEESQKRKRR